MMTWPPPQEGNGGERDLRRLTNEELYAVLDEWSQRVDEHFEARDGKGRESGGE
ncbi:hypothetical protein ACTWP5_04340 [Streptomyces sp. 4N509B]|uniref:hypothetical protein n=1 Tax=Streptomyces sp. 4N509B TaxID=3457413 RepID=UPI003FD258D9